jgi:hypothetical protein
MVLGAVDVLHKADNQPLGILAGAAPVDVFGFHVGAAEFEVGTPAFGEVEGVVTEREGRDGFDGPARYLGCFEPDG